MYVFGYRVARDTAKALPLPTSATGHSNLMAGHLFGTLYERFLGVPRDSRQTLPRVSRRRRSSQLYVRRARHPRRPAALCRPARFRPRRVGNPDADLDASRLLASAARNVPRSIGPGVPGRR